MRTEPSVLHLDVDAFYAAVEQRDKPSLRHKPVIVGGIGARGVVATASYEARRYGVRSAMSTVEARSRCPHAAFLVPRFQTYRLVSEIIMTRLRELSPLVEPLSVDEAFIDLAPCADVDRTLTGVRALGQALRVDIERITGGLTASVGVGSSKLVAKIASELGKPDGCVVVPPGTERDLMRPMQVNIIPGVGPATAQRLRRLGVRTVAELERVSEPELVHLLGPAHGSSLFRLARADDDRAVVTEREAKSISVEDTFASDLVDGALLKAIIQTMSTRVAERLSSARLSGRTVVLKARRHDFSTHTRSATLPGPTDDRRVIAEVAGRLLREVDTADGVRLLGVGVTGLVDWIQDDLFTPLDVDFDDAGIGAGEFAATSVVASSSSSVLPSPEKAWWPGADVLHTEHGLGWVWGAGLGRVTVRFETAETAAGPVRTFCEDDTALTLLPEPSRIPSGHDAARDAPPSSRQAGAFATHPSR